MTVQSFSDRANDLVSDPATQTSASQHVSLSAPDTRSFRTVRSDRMYKQATTTLATQERLRARFIVGACWSTGASHGKRAAAQASPAGAATQTNIEVGRGAVRVARSECPLYGQPCRDAHRPVVAGSSPPTLTLLCRVREIHLPLGACRPTPGRGPLPNSRLSRSPHLRCWRQRFHCYRVCRNAAKSLICAAVRPMLKRRL